MEKMSSELPYELPPNEAPTPEERAALDKELDRLGIGEPDIFTDAEGKNFAELTGDRGKQLDFLRTRYFENAGPESKVKIMPIENGGYVYFNVNEKNKGLSYEATEAQKEVEHSMYSDPASTEWKGLLEQNKDRIMSEYKIHLQPKKEHIPAALDRLVKLFNDREDLRDAVGMFKVKLGDSVKKGGEVFPELVIYPAPDPERSASGKTKGRENFEKVLAEIAKELADFEGVAQTDKIPRDNAKISDLIYAAQSGGDFKKFLKWAGEKTGEKVIDKYFDAVEIGNKTVYAFRKGEEPPRLKDGSGTESSPEAEEAWREAAIETAILKDDWEKLNAENRGGADPNAKLAEKTEQYREALLKEGPLLAKTGNAERTAEVAKELRRVGALRNKLRELQEVRKNIAKLPSSRKRNVVMRPSDPKPPAAKPEKNGFLKKFTKKFTDFFRR